MGNHVFFGESVEGLPITAFTNLLPPQTEPQGILFRSLKTLECELLVFLSLACT